MTGSFAAKALSLVITILEFVDVRRSSPPKPAGGLLIVFLRKMPSGSVEVILLHVFAAHLLT